MGYSGATYLVQEVCNALFDALFHILPHSKDMDRAEATPSQQAQAPRWETGSFKTLDRLVEEFPVLTRISAAKRLRDEAESTARRMGSDTVSATHVETSFEELRGRVA